MSPEEQNTSEDTAPTSDEGTGAQPEGMRGIGARLRGVGEFVIAFAVMLGAIWLLRTFVMEPFTIPTGSMLPTIQKKDSVYAEKVSLWFDDEPQVGQVYTFTSPEDSSETLIKRVIATGGQTIDLRDGHVYVDGVELDEPYVHGQQTLAMRSDVPITYPYTIPEGCFWAMGDNRGNSADSRVFGPVPYDNLIARAAFRYWPLVRELPEYDVDLGFASFTAQPLQLNIGALAYTD